MTEDVTEKVVSRWKRLPWWQQLLVWSLGGTLVTVACIATAIYFVFSTGQVIAQTGCLVQILDARLDKFKGPASEVFQQQAEAAVRVHLRRASEGKEFLCPSGNFWGKLELARRWTLSSTKFWKSGERDVVLNRVARDALSGKYKYEWPEKYKCVDGYAGTRPRQAWKKAKEYVKWPFTGQTPSRTVGQIGNLSLTCG